MADILSQEELDEILAEMKMEEEGEDGHERQTSAGGAVGAGPSALNVEALGSVVEAGTIPSSVALPLTDTPGARSGVLSPGLDFSKAKHIKGVKEIREDRQNEGSRVLSDFKGVCDKINETKPTTAGEYLKIFVNEMLSIFEGDTGFYGNPFRRHHFMEMAGEHLVPKSAHYGAMTIAFLMIRKSFDNRADVGFVPGERPSDAWFAYDPEKVRSSILSPRVQDQLDDQPLSGTIFNGDERHENRLPSAEGQKFPDDLDLKTASAEAISKWTFDRFELNRGVGDLDAFQKMIAAFYRRIRILAGAFEEESPLKKDALKSILSRIDGRQDFGMSLRRFAINGLEKGEFPHYDRFPKEAQVDWDIFWEEDSVKMVQLPPRAQELVQKKEPTEGDEHLDACVDWLFDGMDTFEIEGSGQAHKRMVTDFCSRLNKFYAEMDRSEKGIWDFYYIHGLEGKVNQRIKRRTLSGEAVRFLSKSLSIKPGSAPGIVSRILENDNNFQDGEVDWEIFSPSQPNNDLPAKVKVPVEEPKKIIDRLFSDLDIYSLDQEAESYKAMVDIFRQRIRGLDLRDMEEAERGYFIERVIGRVKNNTPHSQALRNWVRQTLTGEALPGKDLLDDPSSYQEDRFEKNLLMERSNGLPEVLLPEDAKSSPEKMAAFVMEGLDLYPAEATPEAYQAMTSLFLQRIREVEVELHAQIQLESFDSGNPSEVAHSSARGIRNTTLGLIRSKINNNNLLGQAMRVYLLALTKGGESPDAPDGTVELSAQGVDRIASQTDHLPDLTPALKERLEQAGKGLRANNNLRRKKGETELPYTEVPSELFMPDVDPGINRRALITDQRVSLGWLFSGLDLYLEERINPGSFAPAILLFAARAKALAEEVKRQDRAEEWSGLESLIIGSIPIGSNDALTELKSYIKECFSDSEATKAAAASNTEFIDPVGEDIGNLALALERSASCWDFIRRGVARYRYRPAEVTQDNVSPAELKAHLFDSVEGLTPIAEFIPRFFATMSNLFNENWLKTQDRQAVHKLRAEIIALFDQSPIRDELVMAVNAYFEGRWEVYMSSAKLAETKAPAGLTREAFVHLARPEQVAKIAEEAFQGIELSHYGNIWQEAGVLVSLQTRIDRVSEEFRKKGYRAVSDIRMEKALCAKVADGPIPDELKNYIAATVNNSEEKDSHARRLQTLALSANREGADAYPLSSDQGKLRAERLVQGVLQSIYRMTARVDGGSIKGIFGQVDLIEEAIFPTKSIPIMNAILQRTMAMIQDTELGRQLKEVLSVQFFDRELFEAKKLALLSKVDNDKPYVAQIFTSFEGDYDGYLPGEEPELSAAYERAGGLCEMPQGCELFGDNSHYQKMVNSFVEKAQKDADSGGDALLRDACIDRIKGGTPLAEELRLFVADAFSGRPTATSSAAISRILTDEGLQLDWGILGERKIVESFFPETPCKATISESMIVRDRMLNLPVKDTIKTWTPERRSDFLEAFFTELRVRSPRAEALKKIIADIIYERDVREDSAELDKVLTKGLLPSPPDTHTLESFRGMIEEFADNIDREFSMAGGMNDDQRKELLDRVWAGIFGNTDMAAALRNYAEQVLTAFTKTDDARGVAMGMADRRLKTSVDLALAVGEFSLPWRVFVRPEQSSEAAVLSAVATILDQRGEGACPDNEKLKSYIALARMHASLEADHRILKALLSRINPDNEVGQATIKVIEYIFNNGPDHEAESVEGVVQEILSAGASQSAHNIFLYPPAFPESAPDDDPLEIFTPKSTESVTGPPPQGAPPAGLGSEETEAEPEIVVDEKDIQEEEELGVPPQFTPEAIRAAASHEALRAASLAFAPTLAPSTGFTGDIGSQQTLPPGVRPVAKSAEAKPGEDHAIKALFPNIAKYRENDTVDSFRSMVAEFRDNIILTAREVKEMPEADRISFANRAKDRILIGAKPNDHVLLALRTFVYRALSGTGDLNAAEDNLNTGLKDLKDSALPWDSFNLS